MQVLFDFNKQTDKSKWVIVDDVVMGGRSSGYFEIESNGHGHFFGQVSLENNGGFSSLRHEMKPMSLTNYTTCILRLKGDGKTYQFRVKSNRSDYQSYITEFFTTGEWQEISINLKDLYPVFRGRTLDMPTYDLKNIEELSFLIANKKAEQFDLLLDKIELK